MPNFSSNIVNDDEIKAVDTLGYAISHGKNPLKDCFKTNFKVLTT